MKVLIIGANGFLGRKLIARFQPTDDILGADVNFSSFSFDCPQISMDITNSDEVFRIISDNKPDLTNLDNAKYANEEVEEQLVKELSTPFKEVDEQNIIRVESKKALKTRGEHSPDLAEGLGLTFAEEVDPEDHPTSHQERLGITTEILQQLSDRDNPRTYNPLNYMDTLTDGKEVDFLELL